MTFRVPYFPDRRPHGDKHRHHRHRLPPWASFGDVDVLSHASSVPPVLLLLVALLTTVFPLNSSSDWPGIPFLFVLLSALLSALLFALLLALLFALLFALLVGGPLEIYCKIQPELVAVDLHQADRRVCTDPRWRQPSVDFSFVGLNGEVVDVDYLMSMFLSRQTYR